MRVLLQRVSSASVAVNGELIGAINRGLVAFVGIGHDDNESVVDRMAVKATQLRIFQDAAGKMNLSLQDAMELNPEAAGVLVVSQFTLYADARKGRRPSFTDAAPPKSAEVLVDRFAARIRDLGGPVAQGRFGEHMVVSLQNDGPVTIWLESSELGIT